MLEAKKSKVDEYLETMDEYDKKKVIGETLKMVLEKENVNLDTVFKILARLYKKKKLSTN